MNLSKGTIFMAISGLVGLGAMYAVHHYISAQTQVAAKPVNQVMVAAADISPGTIITKTMVKSAIWPRELISPKAAGSLTQLEGRTINTPVTAGEPILLTKLAPEGASAGLAGLLSEGKRALSVRVDDVSGVAGFIHRRSCGCPDGNGQARFRGPLFQNHPAKYRGFERRPDLGAG